MLLFHACHRCYIILNNPETGLIGLPVIWLPQWKSERRLKEAILLALTEKEESGSGYNLLYDEVHSKTGCGRDQFNRSLSELLKESLVLREKSTTHRHGVVLRLGEKAYKYAQDVSLTAIARSLLSILPFAEEWETGSIEEQLAHYDIAMMRPFRLKVELTSKARPLDGKTLIVEGTYDREGLRDAKSRVVLKRP
jgi:hypothetical protein